MALTVTPSQWFQAAINGDVEQLQRWHKAGVLKKQRFEPDQVSAKSGDGRPTLARLVTTIDDGPQVDALQVALEHRQTRYAIALLELSGISAQPAPGSSSPSPMELVGKQFVEKNLCTQEHIRLLVTLLSKQGLSLNQSYQKQSALEHALDQRDVLLVKLLLELGADPNQGKHGNVLASYIHSCPFSQPKHLALVDALLQWGADPNGTCQVGNLSSTPLVLAAALWTKVDDPHHQLVRTLLAAGADPDLAIATAPGKTETAGDLIQNPQVRMAFQEEVSRWRVERLDQTLPTVEAAGSKKVRL